MFALLALFLFGVAVIAVAAVVLLRSAQATEPREARYPDPERGEREVYEELYGERSGTVPARNPDQEQVEKEVYEELYGKRSGTVSAPLPAEPPPKGDADSSRARTPSANPGPRTRRRSRARGSHR
jgi:hypothetical protein